MGVRLFPDMAYGAIRWLFGDKTKFDDLFGHHYSIDTGLSVQRYFHIA